MRVSSMARRLTAGVRPAQTFAEKEGFFMETKGIARQQRFIALAATHAEDFKTRVAQHDRENSFPFGNVEAMKASGYTTMEVPEELGGGGASVLDFVLAEERLARGDGPTTVAINMHLIAVGIFADFW